jgi:hypothetical protein
MNDKSIPQELITYRRYVLKTMWGGATHWFAASRGDIEIDHLPPRELQDARKMGEMYFDSFEKEVEKLLAYLLKACDCMTGSRLCEVKSLGSMRDMLPLGDGHKDAKLV